MRLNLTDYSGRRVALAFTPLFYLLLLVVVAFMYSGDTPRIMEVFIFSVLIGVILILPYLIFPIGCLVLLFMVENFYNFTLDLLGITGDVFTWGITLLLAISYAVLNTIVFGSTVLSIILIRVDTERSLDMLSAVEKFSLTKLWRKFSLTKLWRKRKEKKKAKIKI